MQKQQHTAGKAIAVDSNYASTTCSFKSLLLSGRDQCFHICTAVSELCIHTYTQEMIFQLLWSLNPENKGSCAVLLKILTQFCIRLCSLEVEESGVSATAHPT